MFGLAQLVGNVSQCVPGVTHQHSRPGIAHDDSRLLTLSPLVAMYRATRTNGFALAIRAFVQTLFRILEKALAAQTRAMSFARVMVPTINLYHPLDGQKFPAQTAFERGHSGQTSRDSCFCH